MAKGKTIYFSRKDIEALLKVLEEWEIQVGENIYAHRVKYDLGVAWRKLAEAKNNW